MAQRSTAVIFDLDGTLVDSEPNYFEATRRLLAEHGIADFGWAEHARHIGISTRQTLVDLTEEYQLTEDLDRLLARKNELYLELARAHTEAFPQMRQLVALLAGAGVTMAVASGSSHVAIETALRSTGLTENFALLLSADEAGRSKPEPDVFVEAARRLGTHPHDCVVLEDSGPGIEAAAAAGCRCVAVPYPAGGGPRQEVLNQAGLVFADGPESFDPQRALDWITAG